MKIIILIFGLLALGTELSPLNFVSGSETWKTLSDDTYGDMARQGEYGEEVKNKIVEYSKIIESKTFDDVMKMFADLRLNLARKYNHRSAEEYGVDRVGRAETPLCKNFLTRRSESRYDKYGEILQAILKEKRKFMLRNMIEINGKSCTLSVFTNIDALPILTHCAPELIETFIDEAREEFNLAKASQGDELIAHVARMHFFLSAATKYSRGSSAISEYISRTLLLSKGIALGPIGNDVPDLEALVYADIEKFTSEYLSYYLPVIYE